LKQLKTTVINLTNFIMHESDAAHSLSNITPLFQFFGWKSTSVKPKGGPAIDKATEKFNLFQRKVSEHLSESEDDDDPRKSK
jgi:hypothetical protein